PRRLRRLLTYVIENAIRFTERGSVTMTLSLAHGRPGSRQTRLNFTVRDTGTGIPREDQELLFHPQCAQERQFTLSHPRGGVSLLVAKNLAQSLGGDVVLVDSKPGVGTTFEISIDPGRMDNVTWVQEFSEKDFDRKEAPP